MSPQKTVTFEGLWLLKVDQTSLFGLFFMDKITKYALTVDYVCVYILFIKTLHNSLVNLTILY
jgi:hypothetical protein